MKQLSTLLFFLWYSFQHLIASHVAGVEINYDCPSNDTVLIRLIVMRDCSGITIPSSYNVRIYPDDTSCIKPVRQVSLSRKSISDYAITCPSKQTICSGGSFSPGFQKHYYEAKVPLDSFPCNKFIIEWVECCRNNNISTGPAGTGYFARINGNFSVTGCLPSPQYKNDPIFLYNVGADYSINLSAALPDSSTDIIEYSWIEPLEANNDPVGFSTPYSYRRPFYFHGFPMVNDPLPKGLHFDSLNGQLKFRPTKEEVSIISFKAKRFRIINGNKTFISESLKEEQLIFKNNPNNKIPLILGPESWIICKKDSMCITINTADSNATDSLQIKVLDAPNWLNINLVPGKRPILEICAFPEGKPANNAFLLIELSDGACDFPGKSSRVIPILVLEQDTPIPFYSLSQQCGQLTARIDSIKFQDTSRLSIKWTFDNQVVSNSYTWTKSLDTLAWKKIGLQITPPGGCFSFYQEDSILITPQGPKLLNFPQQFVCREDSVWIKPSINGYFPPFSVSWQNGPIADSIFIGAWDTLRIYRYTVTDSLGCSRSDSIAIYGIHPADTIDAGPNKTICPNQNYPLLATKFTGGIWRGDYVVKQGTNYFFDAYSATPGKHKLYYEASSINDGCYIYDTTFITVFDRDTIQTGPAQHFCINQTPQLLTGYPAGGSWIGQGVRFKPGSGFEFQPATAGIGAWWVKYRTLKNGCSFTDSVLYTVHSLPIIKTGNDTTVCLGSTPFSLMAEPVGGYWENNDSVFDPSLTGPGTFTRWYSYTSPYGCTDSDKVIITVKDVKADFSYSLDTPFVPSKITLTNNSTGANRFNWDMGNGSVLSGKEPQYTYTVAGTYTVLLTAEDSLSGCTDTLSQTIIIQPDPTIGISVTDPLSWSIYPNPAQDEIKIRLFGISQSARLFLTDLQGRLLSSYVIPESGELLLPRENLASGTYFIQVQHGTTQLTARITWF